MGNWAVHNFMHEIRIHKNYCSEFSFSCMEIKFLCMEITFSCMKMNLSCMKCSCNGYFMCDSMAILTIQQLGFQVHEAQVCVGLCTPQARH